MLLKSSVLIRISELRIALKGYYFAADALDNDQNLIIIGSLCWSYYIAGSVKRRKPTTSLLLSDNLLPRTSNRLIVINLNYGNETFQTRSNQLGTSTETHQSKASRTQCLYLKPKTSSLPFSQVLSPSATPRKYQSLRVIIKL